MAHLIAQLMFLAAAGPLTAIALVHLTGRLTWRRILLAAANCQWLIVLAYLAARGVIVITYGTDRATAADFWLAQVQFAGLFMVLGLGVATLLAPIARRLLAGRTAGLGRPNER